MLVSLRVYIRYLSVSRFARMTTEHRLYSSFERFQLKTVLSIIILTNFTLIRTKAFIFVCHALKTDVFDSTELDVVISCGLMVCFYESG